MSTSAAARPTHALPRYTTALAWVFAVGCAVGGVLEAAVGPRDEQPILAAAILVAGAVLVAAGWFAATRGSRWPAVALVTIGALVVGTLFFWTILGPIVAIALIVLFVMDARRGTPIVDGPAG